MLKNRRQRGLTLIEVMIATVLIVMVLGSAVTLLDSSTDLTQSVNNERSAAIRVDRALAAISDEFRRGSLATATHLDGSPFEDGDSGEGFQISPVTGWNGAALTGDAIRYEFEIPSGAPEGNLVRSDGSVETLLARGITSFEVARTGSVFIFTASSRAGPEDDRARVASGTVRNHGEEPVMRLALLIVLALAATAHATDTVEVKSGEKYVGQIVREENGWIGLETDTGVVWIKPDEIKTVTRGTQPAPQPTPEPPPQPVPDANDEIQSADAKPAPKDTADPEKSTASDGSEPGTRPAATEADAEAAAESRRMVAVLASPERKRRVDAAEWIASHWPDSKPTLELALRAETEAARIEAVRLLDEEKLGDTTSLLGRPLRDKSATVQISALRVIRHRRYTDFELDVVNLMVSAQSTAVRNEAVRTLEEIGGAAALPHVFREWAGHDDKNERRRYRRVLQRLIGENFGDDLDAWREAVDEVNRGDRKVRSTR